MTDISWSLAALSMKLQFQQSAMNPSAGSKKILFEARKGDDVSFLGKSHIRFANELFF
jgi:hypothetical protein